MCVYLKTEVPQEAWESLGLGRNGAELDRNGSVASGDRTGAFPLGPKGNVPVTGRRNEIGSQAVDVTESHSRNMRQ